MSLQEMRKKKGWSQGTLADVTGISVRNIQHYESGYRDINNAKLDTLCTLALSLDCKIENIITDDKLKTKLKRVSR